MTPTSSVGCGSAAMSLLPRRCLIDPRDLAEDLAALWDECEAAAEGPLCRALTANLVVVGDASAEDDLDALVRDFVQHHPCRAFVLLAGEDDHPLRAELGAAEVQIGEGRQTVLEQVIVRFSAGQRSRAAGLVRPLLAQDVPTYLLWLAPWPAADDELLALARLADQVLADSCRSGQPLAELAARLPPGARLVDLTDSRTQPWRRALAEAFEHFAWQQAPPTTVRIRHAAGCAARAVSSSLGTWLQRRLAAAVTLDERRDGPEAVDLVHGAVHVAVERRADLLQVKVTHDDLCLLPWTVPVPVVSLGQAVADAVRRHG